MNYNIELLNINDYDKVYVIMEQSFPCIEYRVYNEQYRLMSLSNYKIYVIKHDSDIIGFISIWLLSKYVFVEHFAINELYRGKGIGENLLRYIKDKYSYIILEVELPHDINSKRRINFYNKHGFKYNDYEYSQPPLRVDYPYLDLAIMSYPASLSNNEFKSIVDELYKIVYKI